MNLYAVIVAGGKGLRMGGNVPKQFMLLGGKPVLLYSVITFMETFPGIRMVIVLPEEFVAYTQTLFEAFPGSENMRFVKGGETRFHSVQNGLKAIDGPGYVFVHDGARPLVQPELLERCLEEAQANGAAIPAIAVADSIRIIDAAGSHPVDRDNMRIVQTPQTFRSDLILAAFDQVFDPAFTDEATVAEAAGIPVTLVPGDKRNIKITTPEDLLIAEAYLKKLHLMG